MDVVTLGGNAILPATGKGTIQEQISIATAAMSGVADLIVSGRRVVISHGNGPIVGNILIRNEAAKEIVPPMPIDVCGADSQGGIGYMLQQVLRNQLIARNVRLPVVSLVTQCVVSPDDPAFESPSKPIGPFFTAERAAELEREKGWDVREDSGRGFRRVVASPRPVEIVEWEAIRALIDAGAVVIAVGGGGVPVVRDEAGQLNGVEAVIDKDRASAVLARQLQARRLIVLTSVPRVALDFGQPTQRDVERLTVDEARAYLAEGQFPDGSMGPKVEACVGFVESGGKQAIISSPDAVIDALEGRAGTRIVPAGSESA